MKSISMPILGFFAFMAVIFLSYADADANENTCMLKSIVDEVFVTVWDEDSGQDRQGKIFEGSLKSGELKKITSSTGYIEFSYKEPNDDRSYGNNHKRCKGGNTIHVP